MHSYLLNYCISWLVVKILPTFNLLGWPSTSASLSPTEIFCHCLFQSIDFPHDFRLYALSPIQWIGLRWHRMHSEWARCKYSMSVWRMGCINTIQLLCRWGWSSHQWYSDQLHILPNWFMWIFKWWKVSCLKVDLLSKHFHTTHLRWSNDNQFRTMQWINWFTQSSVYCCIWIR